MSTNWVHYILVPGDDKDKDGEIPRGDYDHLTTFLGAIYGGNCITSNMGCLDFLSDCVDNQCQPRAYFWALLVIIPTLFIGLCCLCVCLGGCPWISCLLSLFCCCCDGDSCCCCHRKEEETSDR